MSISLAELKDIPRLGMAVVAGESGLRRPVTWGHVSELEDPTPWLEGGELLMSIGFGLPDDPKKQVQYITRLARRGVAGWALAETAHPRVSDELRRAADRLPVPLFSVEWQVSFGDIARTVAVANEQVSQRRLLTHVHIFDSLQSRLVDGFSVAELFVRLGHLTGYDLFLATGDGLELLEGVPTPPEHVTTLLPSDFLQAVSIDEGYILPIVLEGKPVGHLVAIERDGKQPTGLVAVQHIATVVALEVDRERQAARVADTYRGRTLADMLDGEIRPPAIRRRLADEGLDPDGVLVLATIAPSGDPREEPRGVAYWSDRLRQLGIPHLLAPLDHLYLLAPDTQALFDVLAAGEMRVGASRPFLLRDGHGLAQREAVLAMHVAERTGRPLGALGRRRRPPVRAARRPGLARAPRRVGARAAGRVRPRAPDRARALLALLPRARPQPARRREEALRPRQLARLPAAAGRGHHGPAAGEHRGADRLLDRARGAPDPLDLQRPHARLAERRRHALALLDEQRPQPLTVDLADRRVSGSASTTWTSRGYL